MPFMVGPIEGKQCTCTCDKVARNQVDNQSEESYDFNTLRKQWSELSKGFIFPYNKKMTGVFGLALFDSPSGIGKSQCTCKEFYQRSPNDGCTPTRVCLCKRCKSAGCQVCIGGVDTHNHKRLMASETVCYTCPCSNGGQDRQVCGYHDADYPQDIIHNSTKYRGYKEGKHTNHEINRKEFIGKRSSPSKFLDGTISDVMGFRVPDSRHKTEEHGHIQHKPPPRRGCSKCTPYSACPTCSHTSYNACGYNPHYRSPKNLESQTICQPYICQRLLHQHPDNIPKVEPPQKLENISRSCSDIQEDNVNDISEHHNVSDIISNHSSHPSEKIIEQQICDKSPDTMSNSTREPPEKLVNTPTKPSEPICRCPDKTSYKSDRISEQKMSNKSDKSDRISNQISDTSSRRRPSKIPEYVEKLPTMCECTRTEGDLSESSKSIKIVQTSSDCTNNSQHKQMYGCKCMERFAMLIIALIALALAFTTWSYMHKTWPFKPKCSTRYHLYTRIKPYKR